MAQPVLNEDWSINSAAGTVELLRDAACRIGFDSELFPPTAPRRWNGLESTGWRVSHDYFTRVFQAMQRDCDDPALGIRLAGCLVPRAFNNLVYLFISSADLETALDRWVRFQALFTTASRLRILYQGNTVRLSASLTDGRLRGTVAQVEYGLGLFWRYANWLTGGEVALKAIELTRDSTEASPYEALFGAPVKFGMPSNALVFDREVLQAQSVHASMAVFVAMERLVEQELRDALPTSVSARVSSALRAIGSEHAPDLQDVAACLCMSRRTLQRRLMEEGVSFSQLVDSHCRDLALDALGDSGLTNADVAERCGYIETRSFYRAFSRWTGTTPLRFRGKTGT